MIDDTTTHPLDIPERVPNYKVIKVVQETDKAPEMVSSLKLVKLSRPHVFRKTGTTSYLETDHVHVGVAKLTKTDATGTFTYEESQVTASDEEGTMVEATLYVSPRALSMEEIMFAIGEV